MPKVYYAASLGLPNGFRMRGYDEKDVLALVQDPKQLVRVADILNLYTHQKGGLVWGRTDLCEILETEIKFKPLTKTVKVDGKDVEEWNETEAAYINRFVETVAKGEFKLPGFTPTGADAKAKEEATWTALQTYANKCGDTTEAGEPCFDAEGKAIPGRVPFAYTLDISRAEPKAKKAKGPTKDAIDGATQILNGGAERVKAWMDKFTKGYKDPNGIDITPIVFQPFNAVAPKGAKAEEVEAVKQANIKNLALAIDAKEAQVRAYWAAKRKTEFA